MTRVLLLSEAEAIRGVLFICARPSESKRQDDRAATWRAVCDCSLDLVPLSHGQLRQAS